MAIKYLQEIMDIMLNHILDANDVKAFNTENLRGSEIISEAVAAYELSTFTDGHYDLATYLQDCMILLEFFKLSSEYSHYESSVIKFKEYIWQEMTGIDKAIYSLREEIEKDINPTEAQLDTLEYLLGQLKKSREYVQ